MAPHLLILFGQVQIGWLGTNKVGVVRLKVLQQIIGYYETLIHHLSAMDP